ncbi:MAG: glutamate-1-semialdehyde 2,1-aminomutase [Acutalibacteraceae bacterium]
MNTEKSASLFSEAQQYIPGGVNSPVRAFKSVGSSPLFIKKAKGAYLFDEDGNRYLDYVCSWGPGILGHASERVIRAVKNACEDGLTFGAPTKKETELAKMITEFVPAAEQARLVSSGTEAVMSAIRLARGYTGRDKIIKFEGNYHGHSDGLLVKAGSGLLTDLTPAGAGVPEGYTKSTLLAGYNDEESVKELFSLYPDSIAAVIVEPVAANMGVVPPKAGFLEFLREITEKHGTVLIFDEVITGFRLALGGAGEYYGVKPDMVTLGKIVGGGMPLAAYCGRKDIMQCVAPVGSVYQAGTLSGNPVAVTAGIETLKILSNESEVYARLDRKTSVLEQAFKEKGLQVNRVGSLLSAFFTDVPVTDYETAKTSDTEAFARYFSYMLENGIYVAPSQFEAMFVSATHTDADIERTAQVIREYKAN